MFWLIIMVGLLTGSFITALTWRLPRGIDFLNDRSRCDKCDAKIYWYDNIPLLSYLLLKGKCRGCGKKISIRYPLIESLTAVTFATTYLVFVNCSGLICGLDRGLGFLTLPYLLVVTVLMLAIFVTDFELQIIPDEFVFLLFGLNSIILILFFGDVFYANIFSGFLTANIFLMLNFMTKGRGMGFGDAKLALFMGSFLGLNYSFLWLFLSFVIGAVIGLVLIFFKKTKFGIKIAFGPFMVFSFFLVVFWGDVLLHRLFPYLN